MNPIIQEIETVLRQDYPIGFGKVFIGYAQKDKLSIESFKKKIGLALTDSFYEYYEWLMTVVFEGADVTEKTRFTYDDNEHFVFSIEQILSFTKDWQNILIDDPKREWKEGFVSIASWNSCYEMVIDTKGEVGKVGNILYFDFKGGGEYIIKYENFNMFLQTKLALLKEKLYFPPNFELEEDAFEDFMDGDTRAKIEKIEEEINGKSWARFDW